MQLVRACERRDLKQKGIKTPWKGLRGFRLVKLVKEET